MAGCKRGCCHQMTVIQKAFGKYGRFIAEHPIWFVILPIVICGLLGLGLINISSETDLETLYVPVNSQTDSDRTILSSLFPDKSSTNYFYQSLTKVNLYGEVVIKTTHGGDLLSPEVVQEIGSMVTQIKQMKVDDEESGFTFDYSDICARTFSQCFITGESILRSSFIQEYMAGNVTYPKWTNFQNYPVDLSMSINGNVDNNNRQDKVVILRLMFNLRQNSEDKSKKWVSRFIMLMANMTTIRTKITYSSSSSLQNELNSNTSSGNDITWFSLSLTLVITYAALVVCGGNCLSNRYYLSLAGVIGVCVAILASFGFLGAVGVKFVDIIGVMPFLALGVGIDSMFVILSEWAEFHHKDSVEDQMEATLRGCGGSVAIASLTNVATFLIGTSSRFISIRNFCAYTGLALLCSLLCHLTFFLGCLTLHGRRVLSGRHCLTCLPVTAVNTSHVSPNILNAVDKQNFWKKSDNLNTPNTSDKLNTPSTSDILNTPNTSNNLNTPNTSDNLNTPNTSDNLNTPNTSDELNTPSTSDILNTPNTSNNLNTPNTSDNLNTPNTSDNLNTPNTSDILNTPNTSDKSNSPNRSWTSDTKIQDTQTRISLQSVMCAGKKSTKREDDESFLEKLPRSCLTNIFTLRSKRRQNTSMIVIVPILVVYFAYVGVSVWGAVNIKQGLLISNLLSKDSYLQTYDAWTLANFETKFSISLNFQNIDYLNQEQIQSMMKFLLTVDKDRDIVNNSLLCWYHDYSTSPQFNNSSPESFIANLKPFLQVRPYISNDVEFTPGGSTIKASRCHVTTVDIPDSSGQGNMMLRLRKLAGNSNLDVFAFSPPFIFFEQYVVILANTLQTVGIAVVCVIVITTIFMPHPVMVVLVAYNMISILLGIFGFLYIWDLTLSSITMTHLIMSVGFSVDFSVHVCHGFMSSEKDTRHKRTIDALTTSAAPVINGGISSFVGILALLASESYVFKSFFKVMILVISFGLAHSMLLLPVILSLIGPENKKRIIKSEMPKSIYDAADIALEAVAKAKYAIEEGWMSLAIRQCVENGIGVVEEALQIAAKDLANLNKANNDSTAAYEMATATKELESATTELNIIGRELKTVTKMVSTTVRKEEDLDIIQISLNKVTVARDTIMNAEHNYLEVICDAESRRL